MPLIIVYNLHPEDYKKVDEIEDAIAEAIVTLPELELDLLKISFSFPQDPTISSHKVPVTIIVELLFDNPKRTNEVRQALAERIAHAFRALDKKQRPVEVAVKRFDPGKEGFCLIK